MEATATGNWTAASLPLIDALKLTCCGAWVRSASFRRFAQAPKGRPGKCSLDAGEQITGFELTK